MTQMTAPVKEEIVAIVGGENFREADRADEVDGVSPAFIVHPGTPAEVGKVLACARQAELAVSPRGGGTKRGWGNPPQRVDLVVSTARLNKVLEHAWSDMTATVQAGCVVAQFQRTLAEHGQRLALDALWPERATIGGILAANDSGTLRTRFGSLRDLVIGVTVALADGTLARSGGKVVKNVAGYDLPKLMTGSLGTLGVITEAVFRLHSLPHETRSLSFGAPSFETLGALANKIRDSRLAYVRLQLRARSGGEALLDVAFEGTRAGLDAQEKQLLAMFAEANLTDSSNCWAAREALWEGGDSKVVAGFSVLPTDLAGFYAAVEKAAAEAGASWQLVAQAIGVGQVSVDGASEDALLAVCENLRAHAETRGGHLVVLHCPRRLKSRFPVWGSPGSSIELMRQVKAQLDPGAVLNPGRFVGGI